MPSIFTANWAVATMAICTATVDLDVDTTSPSVPATDRAVVTATVAFGTTAIELDVDIVVMVGSAVVWSVWVIRSVSTPDSFGRVVRLYILTLVASGANSNDRCQEQKCGVFHVHLLGYRMYSYQPVV